MDRKIVGDSWRVLENFRLNWKFQLDLIDRNTDEKVKILNFNLSSVMTSVMLGGFLKKIRLNWKFKIALTDKNANRPIKIFWLVKTLVLLGMFLKKIIK
jgi:hypothetical protein